MTREVCRMMILNQMSMSQRDLSHQTPTWIRSVEGDFLWWRRILYCTVTSTTRTKRVHQSAGGARPPTVRPLPHPRIHRCNRGSQEFKAVQMWRLNVSRCFWFVCVCMCVCLCVGAGCVILPFPVPPCSREAKAHINASGIQLGGRQRRPGQAEEREQERWVGGSGKERKRKGGRKGQRELRWVGGDLIISSPSQISQPKSRRISWPVKTDNMLDISSCLYLLHMFIIYHSSPPSSSLSLFLFPSQLRRASEFGYKKYAVALATV